MKTKKSILRRYKGQWVGLLFAMPIVLGFLLVFFNVVFQAFEFSFCDVQLKDGITLKFNGIENYKYALRVDPAYIKLLISNLQSLVTTLPIILVFSLFIAVVLNTSVWGRGAFRAIFFLPVIACTGLLSGMSSNNLLMVYMDSAAASQGSEAFSALGDASLILQQMNLSPTIINIAVSAADNIIQVVNSSGVQILFFLAGIQSISPSLYESARVEGSSEWTSFWKITLPMVTPYIYVNLIYTFIQSMTESTELTGYIKGVCYSKGMIGESSAMAMIRMFAIALIIVAILIVVKLFFKFYNREIREEFR